jgi:hypothetical protein
MGDLVNRTRQVAEAWQAQLVWIRINVAYIEAELPHLRSQGHDTADIEPVLARFNYAFSTFSHEEHQVFVAVRSVETQLLSRSDLAIGLRKLSNTLQPWVTEYDQVVRARRNAHDTSLALSLLQGCGAELLEAHGNLVRTVDDYARDIEHAS